ncbi:PaaD-like protein (DUF59) involved in Fe-S cluster assembly [Bartonella ancashensis]|uniref:PaaD-like protein (DUF59) involved in Fe-S cluster assembly n=2 Tax=Bartonella ancashensis TaxID=1318743 RepID=A0A0M5KSP7_9HYPH|nr:SUF system Fe-S cluster assembly protein [Bartonella ancashensis]ALE03786.1 PaaD-like protein (DUF59) involved in Fe-S cluster assembly [Bartonella ancashensis]
MVNSVKEGNSSQLISMKEEEKKNPILALSEDEISRMTDDIIAALKTVYDPEIPADIYELGLIYRIDIEDNRLVKIEMTLTAPGCPVAAEMPVWVENAVGAVAGVLDVEVTMTFDPPWTPECMSEEAQVATGWYQKF